MVASVLIAGKQSFGTHQPAAFEALSCMFTLLYKALYKALLDNGPVTRLSYGTSRNARSALTLGYATQ
jgi:hypothetical protein